MAKGVTIDIAARISGYEQSLAQLRAAIQKLDPGSALARSLNKGLAAAESQVKSLGKNLNPKFTSDAQLDKFIDKFNGVGDVIENIRAKMQDITSTDLNFDTANESIKGLVQQLNELQNELTGNINKGFKDAINNSEELTDAFSKLNIDVKDKNPGEVFEALAKKAEESKVRVEVAARDLNKAQENLTRKQNALSKAENSPINNKEALQNELQELTASYTEAMETIKADVTAGLTNMLGANNPQLDKIATAFLGGLTPDNLKDRLKELKDKLQTELGKGISAKEIYSKLFGDIGKGGNAQAVSATIISKLFPNLNEIKEQFSQKLQEISTSLTTNQVKNINELISEQDIEAALNETLKDIDTAYKKLQGELIQKRQEVAEALAEVDTAKQQEKSVTAESTQITNLQTDLLNRIKALENENQALKDKINEITQTITNQKESNTKEVKDLANKAAETASQWKITADAANQYSEALEKVQQREQLVGKIEGVVQRWFSIYAAVRMVGNAIRSVISTIKELDKTITDITIVTNMSREDLWGQMPQYTQMAQDYAVSISGVYQVSQLFYQQGLQTNDVLTLTGETLKMARIAGLDYAEATNYMTNALRSFKLEMDEASRVTDVYSILAANAAVSVSEIAEAMSKTASSAYAVGSSLENTATMITVMTEATRESASNIGSALKSIISRYGEMTSNPKQLIDSEGEEMSLNKVDRALQSVGITLQDTQGQFRNFDDVIMELASVWDSLDNNTQRYIATVMAGNRQQSRFLALVSSYERYAELSEKAANAAGAGQEQFEKTLEGIEARTQQLQTSLQNLYTSAGLEQLYGGLLGIADNILQYYNSISDAFGNGIQGAIAAVATFGAQFYNIANIVVNVLKLIKSHYTQTAKEIEMLTELEAKNRAGIELTADEEKVYAMLSNHHKLEVEKTKDTQQQTEIRTSGEIKAVQKIKNAWATIKNNKANIAYGIGTVGSIAGTMIGGDAGNWITGASGIVGAAGAFTTGNIVGGIMSLVTAFPALTSAIQSTLTPLKDYNKRLEEAKAAQEAASKSATKAREQIQLADDLKSEINELARLKEARYDSAEAYQAYLDKMNEIANKYPDLIDYYDKEHNAIIRNQEDLETYYKKQHEAAVEAKREAAMAEFRVDDAVLEAEEAISNSQISIESVRNAARKGAEVSNVNIADWATEQTDDLVFTILDNANEALNAAADTKYVPKQHKWYDVITAAENSLNGFLSTLDDITNDELSAWFGYDADAFDNDEAIAAHLKTNGVKNIKADNNSIQEALTSQLITDLQTSYKEFINQHPEASLVDFNFLSEFDQLMGSYLGSYYNSASSGLRENLARQWANIAGNNKSQLDKKIDAFVTTYMSDVEVNSDFESIAVQQALEDAIQAEREAQGLLEDATLEQIADVVEKVWKGFSSDDVTKLLYTGMTDEQINKLNKEVLPNIEQYSKNQLIDLTSELGLNEQALAVFNNFVVSRTSNYYKYFDEYVDEHLSTQKELFTQVFSPETLRILMSELDKIKRRKDKLGDNYDNAINAQYAFWDYLASLASSDVKQYQDIQKAIKQYGTGTLTGLAQLKFEFADNTEFVNLLNGLEQYLDVNVLTEYETFINTFKGQLENLSKALSNATKGMSLDDAFAMATQLDVSLAEFKFIDGKYYYDNIDLITQKYAANYNTVLEAIDEYYIKQIAAENDPAKKAALQQAKENAHKGIEQYSDYMLKSILLEQNQLAGFLASFDYAEEVDLDQLETDILSGDFSNLPSELQAYITLLIDYYNNASSDVYKAFIDSLTNGNRIKIKVTEGNIDTLKYFDKFVEGIIEEGREVYINFANATAEEILAMRENLLHAGGVTESERASNLKALDTKLQEKNTILEQVIDSYSSFDAELANKLAISQGKTLAQMEASGEIIYDGVTNTYRIAVDTLKNMISDDKLAAQLQDKVQSDFDEIGDLLVKAIEGTLSNVEGQKLTELASKRLGIDIPLKQLENGLGASRDKAIETYIALRNINSIAGQIVFDKLKDNLTAAGEECEDIYATMSSIAKLERELQSESNKENKILKDRLSTYKQIAVAQMNDANSYNFMNKSLPSNMQGAMNFWSSSQTMVDTLQAATDNGYLAWNDFYNMATTVNYWAGVTGQEFEFMGRKLNGDMNTFADLIVQSSSALVSTEDGLQLSLESYGDKFSLGAADMQGGIKDGMRAFAQSQIEILDGLIQYLETVVAMENLSTETEPIDWSKPIFGEDGDENVKEGRANVAKVLELAQEMKKGTTEYTETALAMQGYLKSIKIGDTDYTLYDALEQIASGEQVDTWVSKLEAEIQAAWEKLASSVGGDFSVENLLGIFNGANGGSGELPKQELELSLKMTEDGGSIADAKEFAAMVDQFLSIDGTGNITVTGETANAAFTLDIQSDGAAATLIIGGETYNYDSAGGQGIFPVWLYKTFKNYAHTHGYIDIAPISLSASRVSVNNGETGAPVSISIKYKDDSKTVGEISIGEFTEEFGPNSQCKTAAEALSLVARDYNDRYGGGTLHDITFPVNNITVTSANGVTYNFSIDPGSDDLGDIPSQWNTVKTNIETFIAATDNPESAGVIFDIDTSKPDWEVELTSTNVEGTKTIKYKFKVQSQTLTAKLDLQKQWQDVKSNVADLTALASQVPEGTIIGATEDGTGGYSVEIETTDVSGIKTIRYAFDISSDISENSSQIAAKWLQVSKDIATLRRNAQNMPRIFKNLGVKENGDGSYTIEFEDIDVDGNSTITYAVQIGDVNNGLSTTEFANACVTAKTNIEAYKDSYKELMDAAGIKKLGILQYSDGSLKLSADIHVGDGVVITWSSATITGDAKEIIKGISDAKDDLITWKQEVDALNTTANEVLTVNPKPIGIDGSIHLIVKNDKVYFDNGPLAGKKFATLNAAMSALQNNGKTSNALGTKETEINAQATGEKNARDKYEAERAEGATNNNATNWEVEEKLADTRARYEEIQRKIQEYASLTDEILAQRAEEAAEAALWNKGSNKEAYKWSYLNAQRQQGENFDFTSWLLSNFGATQSGFQNMIEQLGLDEEGKWIAQGLYEGLNTEEPTEEVQQMIDTIQQAIEAYAGIASPAEKFKPLGEYIAEGIGEGIQSGDLTPYIQALLDSGLNAQLTITNQVGKVNNNANFSTKNGKDPQTLLLTTMQKMAEVSENAANSTDAISTSIPSINSNLDNVVNAANTINHNMPEEPKAGEWYNTFDGISVHGDFWGEGNQIVLSDGNGGNIHMNLKDYIAQFNQSLIEMQQMASEANIVVDINANNAPFISKLQDAINRANRSTASVKVKMIQEGGGDYGKENVVKGADVKGNVALGKGTLMGELGPELYVTGGHYYIAGRNGAEFVDLPDDAIVFNHLQTKRLLGTGSSGRGKAVTNEKKATAHATGNIAMASAADTLAQLKEIRAVWQAVFDNIKKLAAKGGASGGGGGGKTGLDKGFIADLERWYNLLRLIEKTEEKINYQEKLRSKIQSDRIVNGAAIYESQKQSLELLEEEINYHRELALLQQSYYDARVKAFKESEYSRILNFTDEGLVQYNDKDVADNSDLVGLFELAQINATDKNGQPIYTAKEQYQKLVGLGFGEEMKYTAEGEAIDFKEDDAYATAVEAFWDKLEGWKEELGDLYDSYHEQLNAILDNEIERNKLMQEIVDNQLAVEDKVLEAIENREQAIIDELQDERNALADAADKYLDGLNKQLSKEREMYQQAESAENLRKLRRQLGILERSGGSASQISSLREQISSAEQDAYFDAQQQQIDAIKEASDLEIERLDHQIEIMNETLAYQKENGLLWNEVKQIMQLTPEEITNFIASNDPELKSASALKRTEILERELSPMITQWSEYLKDVQSGKDVVDKGGATFDWNSFMSTDVGSRFWSQILDEQTKAEAERIYRETYAKTGDPTAADTATGKYLNSKVTEYNKAQNSGIQQQQVEEESKETEKPQGKLLLAKDASGGQRYYYYNKQEGYRYSSSLSWIKEHGILKGDTPVFNTLEELKEWWTSGARKEILGYDTGGLADYTGLAMLHGTKSKPEAVLNADQTAVLREDILGSSSNSLLSLLQDFRNSITGVFNTAALSASGSIIIENANVNMNIDSIANDYDAQRAGEQALNRMLEIARKTNVQSLRR